MRETRNRNQVLPTLTALLSLVWLASGCGGGGGSAQSTPTNPGPSYTDVVGEGWSAFHSGDYQGAITRFEQAISMDSTQVEAFSGLGWSLSRLGELETADPVFARGSSKAGSAALRADLFAGWAFLTNARADTSGTDLQSYLDSNSRAGQALTLAPAWSFSHIAGLDDQDLHLLRAANDFLLGEFTQSLTETRVLAPTFTADVATPDGRAALAAEIESLHSTRVGLGFGG